MNKVQIPFGATEGLAPASLSISPMLTLQLAFHKPDMLSWLWSPKGPWQLSFWPLPLLLHLPGALLLCRCAALCMYTLCLANIYWSFTPLI